MKFSRNFSFKTLIPAIPALIVCIVSMHLFLELTDEMLEKDLIKFDAILIDFALLNRSENATTFFSIITHFGDTIMYVAITLLLFLLYYFARERKKEVILLTIVSITGFLANVSLKWLFQRPRPMGNQLTEAAFYSYPSGHAMSSTIFYGFLIYVIWRENMSLPFKILFSIMLSALILLISYSRVYLGVHYASDVIAGILGGAFWIFLFISILKFMKVDLKNVKG